MLSYADYLDISVVVMQGMYIMTLNKPTWNTTLYLINIHKLIHD